MSAKQKVIFSLVILPVGGCQSEKSPFSARYEDGKLYYEGEWYVFTSGWRKNKNTVKFQKWVPGLIFFKGPFWGAYLWSGFIWRGLYMMGICVTKLIGLADSWNTNKRKFMFNCIVFALFYFVFEGNFQ